MSSRVLHRHPQSGESMIMVLIALAIILVAIVALQDAALQSLNLTRKVRGRQSSLEVDAYLGQLVLGSMQGAMAGLSSPLSASCPTLPSAFVAKWPVSSAALGLSIRPLAPGEDIVPTGVTYAGDSDQEDARARCLNSQTANVAGAFGPASTGLYTCLLLTNTASPMPKGSIFEGGPVFAEVAYGFRDHGTDTPVSCSSYSTVGAELTGISVYYTLYWRTKVGAGYSYNHHTGWLCDALATW